MLIAIGTVAGYLLGLITCHLIYTWGANRYADKPVNPPAKPKIGLPLTTYRGQLGSYPKVEK